MDDFKKKGICPNLDCCKLAEEKVVQEVDESNFVCQECGHELVEVGKKRRHKPDLRLPMLIIAALLVLGGLVFGVMCGMKARNQRLAEKAERERSQAIQDSIAKVQADSIACVNAESMAKAQAFEDSLAAVRLAEELAAAEQARLDSIAAAENAAKAATKTTQKSSPKSSGNIDYGKWTGVWKNGKPHGPGTMRYTKEHLIDSRDPQKRVAMPGDYIIGEFYDGKLVQGRWYDTSNNVKGSVIIGM